MPLWLSNLLRPCISRWRILVCPWDLLTGVFQNFRSKPVLVLVHNTSVHFWNFSSHLDFILSTWIFIVDSVFAYRVLFPRSHLVNIVMIILFHIEPCFSRLFGIDSHVIAIFSVNILPDLDIRTMHGFVLILRKIIFTLFMFWRFILVQRKILFIHCICVHGNLISISWKYKRIFILQVTIVLVCKSFMSYSYKRIYFIFSVLIKSDFRLIRAINSFSSTSLLYLSDEWKEPISTIGSAQRERQAVRSLVDL